MKNPITKKEIKNKSFLEILGIKTEDTEAQIASDQIRSSNFINSLMEEIASIKAKNKAYYTAFEEIANLETNSVAKIKEIAKRVVT